MRQALPRVLVEHRQQLQRTPVHRPFEHEVVASRRGSDAPAAAGRTTRRSATAASASAASAAPSAPPGARSAPPACGSPASLRPAEAPSPGGSRTARTALASATIRAVSAASSRVPHRTRTCPCIRGRCGRPRGCLLPNFLGLLVTEVSPLISGDPHSRSSLDRRTPDTAIARFRDPAALPGPG